MQTPQIDYNIYPSLLDLFIGMEECFQDWMDYWGNSEDPSISLEDYAVKCEVDLINAINRCPKEPSEAASRGTAFNEVVDMIIHRRAEPCINMTAKSDKDGGFIHVGIDGFSFNFDTELCKTVAGRYPNGLSQVMCDGILETHLGCVRLYGFVDEWCGDKIYDIKTTSQYQFGKYSRKSQRHCYPFCAIESELATDISSFEYTAVKLSSPKGGNAVISGEIYPEIYTYDHEQSRKWLQSVCERFILWLNFRKQYITDNRIFGGRNPAGYVGKPISAQDITVMSC